jgi:hypothetical protein
VFAGSGSAQLRSAGLIDTIGSTTPTFYIGKGLGELPIDELRPLALTGEVSRTFSDVPGLNPGSWNYAASVQYSMPYMQQHVRALNLPRWVTHLVPIAEYTLSNPDGGPVTSTIAPGVLYEAQSWQLGIEALMPANAAARASQSTGILVQFHIFLDDLAPKSFWGKPLFK